MIQNPNQPSPQTRLPLKAGSVGNRSQHRVLNSVLSQGFISHFAAGETHQRRAMLGEIINRESGALTNHRTAARRNDLGLFTRRSWANASSLGNQRRFEWTGTSNSVNEELLIDRKVQQIGLDQCSCFFEEWIMRLTSCLPNV